MTHRHVRDVVLHRLGPAGYCGMPPVLVFRRLSGGALIRRGELPGFRNGTYQSKLMDEMREQALRLSADLRMEDVESAHHFAGR